MNESVHHFLVAMAGAASLEALKLWDLKPRLGEQRFKKLLVSLEMWIPLILMLGASGFFGWAYYDGQEKVTEWQLAIAGITTRTLLRELVTAKVSHSKRKLGGGNDGVTVADFFR